VGGVMGVSGWVRWWVYVSGQGSGCKSVDEVVGVSE
jgi:hypothetical protein